MFVTAALSAQNPEAQLPLIRSEVKQVVVTTIVTDQSGHHVRDLKAADFEVSEDGKPQRIVAFSIESVAPIPVRTPKPQGGADASGSNKKMTPSSVVPRRTYLIIVDTLHSSFGNFGRVRQALSRLLEQEQTLDAQYALIALGTEANVVQDSTRDAAVVLAAVRSNKFSSMIQNSEASNLALAADQFMQVIGFGHKEQIQQFLTNYEERAFSLNQQFLRQLEQIVRAAASMPTSNTVIFISDGFNRFPGRELYGILQGLGVRDSNFRFQFHGRDTQPELEAIIRVATRHDVKFYTVDSRGLYTQASLPGGGFSASSSSGVTPESLDSEARSVAHENSDVLASLAHETGGLFFENNNDLFRGIQRAFADGREYYVLAYAPENTTMDGTYRKISVAVRDRRWRVSAKAGYWATGN
jgi:VWFA-related protein